MSSPLPGPQAAKTRLLITLVVDTSSSMAHQDAIGDLNSALHRWREELQADSNLRRIGELALVTFGASGVTVVDPSGRGRDPLASPFVPVNEFNPPALRASGYSPMVAAVQRALQLVEQRREVLRQSGIQMAYRPIVYLLTDGAPTDEAGKRSDRWRDLEPLLRKEEDDHRLLFYAFGVRGADMNVLRELAPKGAFDVQGDNFTTVLAAVRRSIQRIMTVGRSTDPDTVHDQVRSDIDEMQQMREWLSIQKAP
jgi:uncharacterized protein YegL